MTETELLDEAAFAWDDGRTSESLQLMKLAIRRDPSLSAARRALAERYRQMGHPDQAGRWGIVFDGWTTAVERDRLARLLASSGVNERQFATFLAVPDREATEVISNLMRDPVAHYRKRYGTPDWAGGTALEMALQCAESVAAVSMWGLCVVLAASARSGAAEVLGGPVVAALTLALAFSTVWAAQRRWKRHALVWALLTVAVASLVLLRAPEWSH